MKKFRVLLLLIVLLLAFCLASASQTGYTYYEWRPATSQCVARTFNINVCMSGHPQNPPCTIWNDEDGILLRENNIVQNQCGPTLSRID
jgi:hypothetical protein